MGINLSKGQRVNLGKAMTLALVGLGWDTNQYDGGYDFEYIETLPEMKR